MKDRGRPFGAFLLVTMPCTYFTVKFFFHIAWPLENSDRPANMRGVNTHAWWMTLGQAEYERQMYTPVVREARGEEGYRVWFMHLPLKQV